MRRLSLLARPTCSGFSLVELMVALAVGLFVVAVGTTLLASQLREVRSLTRATRLMQDLRTTADLVTRDLRRAGTWGDASAGIWQPGSTTAPAANPYAATPSVVSQDTVALRYTRDAVENDVVDGSEQFGYRLRNGAIELQLGAGNWQALTDPATMIVTAFDVETMAQDIPLGGSCVAACAPGAADCPPRLRVQSVRFVMTARSAAEASVVRSLRGEVRLRNDAVLGACPAL